MWAALRLSRYSAAAAWTSYGLWTAGVAMRWAVGEVFSSIHDCQQLISEQLIDYIRTTIVHAGGVWPRP